MDYNIIELHKELIEVQKKLDSLVENEDGEYEKLFNQSIKVDGVIAKYNQARINLENERRQLMKKYEKELETPFKNEMIGKIRTEVRQKFPSVGVKELLQFSTNVYIYATLLANDINDQEIIDQLVFLNNKFIEDSKENEDIIKNSVIDADSEYLLYLLEKYKKLIKEKI